MTNSDATPDPNSPVEPLEPIDPASDDSDEVGTDREVVDDPEVPDGGQDGPSAIPVRGMPDGPDTH